MSITPAKNRIDIPIEMFIRITKIDGEPGERAMLIAKDERGNEMSFALETELGGILDLTVFDLPSPTNTTKA